MPPPVQYAPGQVLPGTVYRVVRHLATGGMGSVYDVEDTTVEKRYVLKTLHPQLVSREDLARRMRDEARSLAKLQHPNIVDVITAGVTSDAVKMPFYVMERLIGQNLRVVLEKKSILELSPALRIAIDVADALEHAHENALVHRDVKPENIFLHRNANGTTTTKLLDFGIVRLLDRKASHTHGKFIGTLRYASPEQIVGNPVGPATDIYSLGLVLYEMLAGRGPFDDAGDQYAIGAAHANQPPPPVSQFVRLAPPLAALVDSCLAKDPEARPRDCFAFASELRRFLEQAEASPRSATAINVFGPDTTAPPTVAAAPPTGMVSEAPVTPTRVEAAPEPVGPASGPISPIAPTLAVAEAPPVTPAPALAAGPPLAAAIDRDAPTRASAAGQTRRLAWGDTRLEEPLAHGLSPAPGELASDDAVRAAFNAPAPLVVPPVGASQPSATPMPELVFPRLQSSVTGPMAGEARTRPPERGPVLLLATAVVLTIAMVGVVFVALRSRRPARVEVAAQPAVATVVAPPPAASASPPPASALPAVSIPSPVEVSAPVPTAAAAPGSATSSPPRSTPAASPVASPRSLPLGRVPAAKGAASGHAPSVSFDP